MQDRNLKALICKIILFYSVFYVIMKFIAVAFNEAWLLPNLVLAIPYLIFAAIGMIMLKQKSFSWIYVVAGILVISLVRYYEVDWLLKLRQYFS
jgi:hypothetical protein